MRTKDILVDSFENVKILYQYLYMDPDNRVKVPKDVGTYFSVRMDDKLDFYATDLDFPNLPERYFTSSMELSVILGIIESLKKLPAEQFPNRFKNRWEEIKEITLLNVGLNLK